MNSGLDDFAVDVLDPVQSRGLYELLLERCRTGFSTKTNLRQQRRANLRKNPVLFYLTSVGCAVKGLPFQKLLSVAVRWAARSRLPAAV